MAALANKYNFRYSSFIGVHPLGSRETRSTTIDNKVTRAFSSGSKVEVVAIGTHDEKPQRWWDESGNRLNAVPFTWERRNPNDVGGGGASSSADNIVRRFVIKMEDLPRDARVSWWRQQGIKGTTGAIISVDGQQNPRGYKAQAIAIAKDRKSINLRVGIAAGPWKTMHKLTSSGYHGRNGKGVTLFAPPDNTKQAQVAISHNYSEQDYRIFAVDKQGKEHIQDGWGGRSSNGIVTAHASFPNFASEEIGHYLFKVREFEWVEIKNLPLQPTKPGGNTSQKPTTSDSEIAIKANFKKAIDTTEVADLKELVDIYEEIFKNVEALHRVAGQGGELHKLLLAKYHWLNARAKLHEEKQEFSKAIEQYKEALKTSQDYVSATQAVYRSGRVTLSALLQAQLLRVEAKRTLRQVERRIANKVQPTDETTIRMPKQSHNKHGEAWSPPENPDPSAIRKEAAEDARQGRYDVALAKQEWYHKNATALQPSQMGVRLSFALNDWRWLADRYPPALEKLQQMRNETEQKVRDEAKKFKMRFEDFHGFSKIFSEYEALNRTLGEEDRTIETFQWLDENYPEQAKLVFRAARKALINQKAKQLYGKYLDPLKDLRKIGDSYQRRLNLKSTKYDAAIRESGERLFVRDVSILVAMLVQLDRVEEAKKVVEESKQLIENEVDLLKRLELQLQSAMKGQLPD